MPGSTVEKGEIAANDGIFVVVNGRNAVRLGDGEVGYALNLELAGALWS